MPVVSIYVSKISSGQPRVGVPVARPPRPGPSVFQVYRMPGSGHNVREYWAVYGCASYGCASYGCARAPTAAVVAATVAVRDTVQNRYGRCLPQPCVAGLLALRRTSRASRAVLTGAATSAAEQTTFRSVRSVSVFPAMAFSALAVCSSIPRRVRRAPSCRYW